jgi:hypothetical protein
VLWVCLSAKASERFELSANHIQAKTAMNLYINSGTNLYDLSMHVSF